MISQPLNLGRRCDFGMSNHPQFFVFTFYFLIETIAWFLLQEYMFYQLRDTKKYIFYQLRYTKKIVRPLHRLTMIRDKQKYKIHS